jgi:hypothetical protein
MQASTTRGICLRGSELPRVRLSSSARCPIPGALSTCLLSIRNPWHYGQNPSRRGSGCRLQACSPGSLWPRWTRALWVLAPSVAHPGTVGHGSHAAPLAAGWSAAIPAFLIPLGPVSPHDLACARSWAFLLFSVFVSASAASRLSLRFSSGSCRSQTVRGPVCALPIRSLYILLHGLAPYGLLLLTLRMPLCIRFVGLCNSPGITSLQPSASHDASAFSTHQDDMTRFPSSSSVSS